MTNAEDHRNALRAEIRVETLQARMRAETANNPKKGSHRSRLKISKMQKEINGLVRKYEIRLPNKIDRDTVKGMPL